MHNEEDNPSVNDRGVGRWTVLSVVLLIVGLVLGYGIAVLSGPPVITTSTQLTTLTITETLSTTVPVTKTYSTTSTETITRTVTTTLITEIKPSIQETYSLKILEVIIDTVSEMEHDYYVFTLEASYKGGKSWSFGTLWLYLLSDKGYKYPSSLSFAERQLLPSAELKDGEFVKGQISFKLPKNESPSKLIYEDEFTGIKLEITDIPPPSRQVSWVYFTETNVKSDYSFIWTLASVKTPGQAFYSGEKIEVELSIKYSRFLDNPAAITIKSITVDRFEIVDTDPKLPITLKDGEEVIVKLILRVPDEGYKGNLKITVYA